MALYREDQCTSAFPWAGQFAQLALSNDLNDSPMIPFAINGKTFKGTLDTGADHILIAAHALARAGVTPSATSTAETGVCIGGLAGSVAVEWFDNVTIGGEILVPPGCGSRRIPAPWRRPTR